MTLIGDLYRRDADSGVLASSLADAQAGNGRVVLLTGPDGIGKTRLLTEARHLAIPDFQTLLARACPLRSDVPFGVARELFQPRIGQLSGPEREALLPDTADQIARALDPQVPLGVSGGEFTVMDSLLWLVTDLCEDRPLALLIDDLQWADAASLKFLTYLVQRIDELRCWVVVAVRDADEAPWDRLLKTIVTYPAVTVLRPSPLTADAVAAIVQKMLARSDTPPPPGTADAPACRKATGGNPLLAAELARILADRQMAADAAAVARIGAVSVADRVLASIGRLPPECRRLAEAVAVLGGTPPLPLAASLADLPPEAACGAAEALEDVSGVLESWRAGDTTHVGFAHPLVHAAVYDAMPAEDRGAAHRHAAAVLRAAGEPLEDMAVHLLRTPPGHDDETVRFLLQAAECAWGRGSAEAATAYLRRCLQEPPAEGRQAHILYELGRISLLCDPTVAVETLTEAQKMTARPRRGAEIALARGRALLLRQRGGEALEAWERALADVPEDETDLVHQIQACILSVPFYEPGRPDMRRGILQQVAAARTRRPHPTPGGKVLDCVVAGHDAILGDPRAVWRALQALHSSPSGDLANLAGGDIALALGWSVLISADREEALDSIDQALDHARHAGSFNSVALALTYRAMHWLARGDLVAAGTDARQAVSASEMTSPTLLRFILGPLRADILMEQGRLDDAEQALAWVHSAEPVPATGLTYYLLCSRSRLLRLGGHPEKALEEALAAGRCYDSAGGANPALVPWRSEAALCLHALGQDDEAVDLVYEELRQARNWSAPRAWGRALRVLGVLEQPAAGSLEHLLEAVDRLRSGSDRLEYAKALAEYGRVLEARGQETEATQTIQEALDLAEHCGAAPLVERLSTARRPGAASEVQQGPRLDLMPPGQRRICELAAAGRTNRQIARELFISVRAVQTRLSQAYQDLGITSRHQLADTLERLSGTGADRAG